MWFSTRLRFVTLKKSPQVLKRKQALYACVSVAAPKSTSIIFLERGHVVSLVCFIVVSKVGNSLQNRGYFCAFSGEREPDVESESRATGKARVSRSTTSSCLPEKREKMAAVLHGGCHSDICNDPHSLECE